MAKEDKENRETFVFDESSRQYIKEEVDFYVKDVNVNDGHHFKSNEIDMNKLMESFKKIGINKLKYMKSYTDIDQSRKLAEILPLNGADMTWSKETTITDETEWFITLGLDSDITNDLFSYRHGYLIPCWSLAALISVLPPIHKLKPILDLEENSIQYSGIDIYVKADNLVDACYEVILKLHELKKL